VFCRPAVRLLRTHSPATVEKEGEALGSWGGHGTGTLLLVTRALIGRQLGAFVRAMLSRRPPLHLVRSRRAQDFKII
jgi:hypothetical protein